MHIGVDACRGGWFATVLDNGQIDTRVHPNITELWDNHHDAERILIDIPIGLPNEGTRECAGEARALLGCRGLSVFDVPPRKVFEAENYEDAKEEKLLDKGLSQQAWGLREKILQVDALIDDNPETDSLLESHPELCFYALNDKNPIAYSKKTKRGEKKRLSVLNQYLDNPENEYKNAKSEYLRKDVARDDILDSMVLAVAAREPLIGVPESDTDERMRIFYPKD